jgi:hypothetical protein
MKPLFKYIGKTGRFKATHGEMEIPDEVEVNGEGRNWILDLINRPFNPDAHAAHAPPQPTGPEAA